MREAEKLEAIAVKHTRMSLKISEVHVLSHF